MWSSGEYFHLLEKHKRKGKPGAVICLKGILYQILNWWNTKQFCIDTKFDLISMIITLKVVLSPICLAISVYADGSICLDILQNQWSPIYDVAAILTSIQVIVLYLIFQSCFKIIYAKSDLIVRWQSICLLYSLYQH